MWTAQKEKEKKCCHFAKLEEGQNCITAHEGVFVNCLSRYYKFFFCLVTTIIMLNCFGTGGGEGFFHYINKNMCVLSY